MHAYQPLQAPVIQGIQNACYRYREYRPCQALERQVACYWTVEYDALGDKPLHRVIPDGCVDLIFDLASSAAHKSAFAAGLMSTFETRELADSCFLFGIRFYADQALPFMRFSPSELLGLHVWLEELWGRDAGPVIEEIVTAGGMDDRIKRANNLLLRALGQTDRLSSDLLLSGMKLIYAKHGVISVRSLAEELCYSERTVRRTFRQELGIGPKETADIIRFQSVLQHCNRSGLNRLTDIAADFGYSDQAHFIRHFKRYYGLAPKQALQ